MGAHDGAGGFPDEGVEGQMHIADVGAGVLPAGRLSSAASGIVARGHGQVTERRIDATACRQCDSGVVAQSNGYTTGGGRTGDHHRGMHRREGSRLC